MLTEDEVKEVGNFLRSNLYFETVETINLFFFLGLQNKMKLTSIFSPDDRLLY